MSTYSEHVVEAAVQGVLAQVRVVEIRNPLLVPGIAVLLHVRGVGALRLGNCVHSNRNEMDTAKPNFYQL